MAWAMSVFTTLMPNVGKAKFRKMIAQSIHRSFQPKNSFFATLQSPSPPPKAKPDAPRRDVSPESAGIIHYCSGDVNGYAKKARSNLACFALRAYPMTTCLYMPRRAHKV